MVDVPDELNPLKNAALDERAAQLVRV